MRLSLPARLSAAALAVTALVAGPAASSALAAPGPNTLRGTDTSRWQVVDSTVETCGTRGPSWTKVAAHNAFVIHRAVVTLASGRTVPDPCYRSSRAASASTGVYQGAYAFVRPTTKAGSAAAAARAFVAVTGRLQEPGSLPPVLDLEHGGLDGTHPMTPKQMQSWVSTWLTTVRSLTGRQPMIYTSPYFWEHSLGNSTAFAQYPLWVAHWGAATPRVPGGWTRWTMWQYSGTATLSGIATPADLDAFNGSRTDLARLAHPATTISTTPSSAMAYRGSTWTLAGRLRAGAGVSPAGRTVKLVVRAKGSTAPWRQVATDTTSADGSFSFVRRPSSAWTYKVRFSGGQALAASWSVQRTHAIADRHATTVSETLSAAKVAKGRAVTVRGSLVRTASKLPLTGKQLEVWTKATAKGSKWVLATTVRTSSVKGAYRATLHPTRSVQVKVVFAGSTANRADTSPVHRLSVR